MPPRPTPDDSHLRDAALLKVWKRRCLDKGLEIARKIEKIRNGMELRLDDIKLGPEAVPGETPLRRLERYMELVDRVIKRFDKGTYGRCKDCGDAIEPIRLDEMAWSERCAPCQEKAIRENRV